MLSVYQQKPKQQPYPSTFKCNLSCPFDEVTTMQTYRLLVLSGPDAACIHGDSPDAGERLWTLGSLRPGNLF